MAYAALVSLQQTSDLILNHPKYSISANEREIIKSIGEYMKFLISFLEDLPEKASRLEGKIRDLANEAEDLIEYFMWNQFQMYRIVGLSRDEFEGRLDRLREEIVSIAGDMMDDRPCHLPAAITSSSRATTDKNDVVIGLHDDLLTIKGRLCGESSKLEVIPIVGMGGIGKTTLARIAYDDSLIMESFHIRAFVQVSQDYNAIEFLLNLISSLKLFDEQMLGETNENVIAEKVYKRLKGRRYLIVMDDVWSAKAWDDMRNIFPDDYNGSRIMLTTRLSDVASYASSGSPLYEVKFMDENHSWNLLKQKVLTDGQDCPTELEDIGKKIAGGCRGLPLAVVLVAGVLSTVDKARSSWEKIAENVNSVVDGQLDKILSMSYRYLPHHLRQCFLFMAGFPEDHNIHVWRLIKLWVAEGFLKHENGYKTLEEEAEEYLEVLINRNLVLINSRRSNGKVKSCSLHDLVRDMCVRKALEEKFFVTDRYVLPNGRKDERRISIGHSRLAEIRSPTTIHTILCYLTSLYDSSLPFLVSFRLLRVLDIVHDGYVNLPPQVFDLIHLRYLAIGFTNRIPAAISNLENLQTLIIRTSLHKLFGAFSTDLPLDIWRMQHLRHLVLPGNHGLLIPTEGSTLPLQNLQTLSHIVSPVCSKRILKLIPNLKKLGINICYRPKELHHDLHNLVNLHQLEKLKITSSESFPWQGQYPAFPTTLKKLTLVGGGQLRWEDMTIVGSLPNLEVLKLKNFACTGDTWETTDGEFDQLIYLLIDNSNIQYWITESSHFPRLKCLVLHRCSYLKEIPDSIGEIPTLEVIEVDRRNKSLVNSAKQIQEEQQSYGNDNLQVHCILSKEIGRGPVMQMLEV